MKKFGKIAGSIVALVLVGCITMTSITFLTDKEKVEAAKASFSGIERIVKENTQSNPFEIIELVPSMNMAEFSYMYEVAEDWEENLRKISSPQERAKYMNDTLQKSLEGLHKGETTTHALSYETYEESYADKNGFHGLELLPSTDKDGMEILPKGNKEYFMEESSSGDYMLNVEYEIADQDSDGKYLGEYRQVIDYFMYSDKQDQYYGVSFENARDENNELSSGTEDLYVVSRTHLISSEEDYNEIKARTPNAYVYRLSYEDIYGAYEFVGAIGSDKIPSIEYKAIEEDTTHFYYTVRFSHVAPETQLLDDMNYYKVRKVDLLVDGKKGVGEYGANPGAMYIKVTGDEEGYFCPKNDLESGDCYRYVGTGNGTHRIVNNASNSDKVIDYDVIIGKIYYKGGYSSNRLLEKEVFGLEETSPAMNIHVTTLTPKMLDERCKTAGGLDGIGLLYISSRSLLREKAVDEGLAEGNSATFSVSNDITWDTAKMIMELAQDPMRRLPVIVDRSIIDGITDKGSYYNEYGTSNIQRMTALMSSLQFFGTEGQEQIVIDESSSVGQVEWWKLQIGENQFGDEFVNQNIYIYCGNNYSDSKNPYRTPYIFENFTSDIVAKSNNGVSVSNDDETKFKEKAGNQGIGEIAEYIIAENKKRKNENNGLDKDHQYLYFDFQISKATIISYIINYVNVEKIEWDSTLHVLEIQPGVTKDDKAKLTAESLKEAFSAYADIESVEVTYMTSGEFIGKIEDLSKYDMIYMGLDTYFHIGNDNNTTITKETKYNDRSMNGLIYTGIGDIIGMGWKSSGKRLYVGMLDSDWKKNNTTKTDEVFRTDAQNLITYSSNAVSPNNVEAFQNATNTFRLSGNDFSKEKLEDVENYVKAGYPLVLDAGFFKGADKKEVNDYYIDNSSNVYELVNHTKDNENVLSVIGTDARTWSSGTVKTIMNHIMVGKPKITILNHKKTKNSTIDETKEFYAVENDTITLDFTVTNQGSADSKQSLLCSIYLDINKDGRFSKTQEIIDPMEMTLKKNGTLVKAKSSQTNGKKTYYYEIQPGSSNTYSVEYKLPEGTLGLIPWKLEIGQADNPLRTVCTQDYFYNIHLDEKGENVDVPKIRILQINTSDSKIAQQKKMDDSGETYDNSQEAFNMHKELENPDSSFAKLKAKINDFDFIVTTISSDTYAINYNDYPSENKDEYFDHCMEDGEAADMLVIGFGDTYQISNISAMNGIIHFINSGKPVLFTHDTTSYNYLASGGWGYAFNTKIRNLVGMDRYGVLSNPYWKKGQVFEKDSAETGENFANALAYESAKEENAKKDVPYLPRSGRTKTVRQTQGPTYATIFHVIKNDDKPNNCMTYWPYTRNLMENYSGWSQSLTTRAAQINEGQITTYPFAIGKIINTAKTHQQYYQLDLNEDMDQDGESDMVVWYSLIKPEEGKKNPIYSPAPRDVRNNYYIYTKGNVTYSGVGHYKINESEEELKLYINTMIAAYNAGTVAPKLYLKESADEDSDDLKVMYVSFDETIKQQGEENVTESSIEEQKNEWNALYFTVKDSNFVRNVKKKVVEIDFGVPTTMTPKEYEDLVDKTGYRTVDVDGKTLVIKVCDDVKITTLDEETNQNPSEDEEDNSQNTSDSNAKITLGAGETYKALIPSSILEGNHTTIYAIARTKFIKGNAQYDDGGNLIENTNKEEVVYSSPTYATFRMQRIGLMDLD